jgi:hypothetical protein
MEMWVHEHTRVLTCIFTYLLTYFVTPWLHGPLRTPLSYATGALSSPLIVFASMYSLSALIHHSLHLSVTPLWAFSRLLYLFTFKNVLSCPCLIWVRDSSIIVATGYGLDGQGLIPGRGKRFLCTPQCSDRLWGHPACYPMGTGGSFCGG